MRKYLNWIVIGLFGGLWVALCFNHNVWTDEVFTMWMLKFDYAKMVNLTKGDVHPPLYYLIAKTAAILIPTVQYRLLVQKIVAIIPVILTMILGSSWMRRRGLGYKVSLVYVIILGCIPCVSTYAVQVRMYSWALLFITICGMAAYDAYQFSRMRDWICMIISGGAAAYTHNFALVSAMIICGLMFILLVVRKRSALIWWGISVSIMAALYFPWFLVLLAQVKHVNQNYWIPEITGETIWGYVEWAFDTSIPHSSVMMLVVWLFVGILHFRLRSKEKNDWDIFAAGCYLVPLLTIVSGVVVSKLMRPIYYNRYVFPTLGILCMFFAISIRNISKKTLAAGLFFVFLTGAAAYRETYREEYYSTYVPETEAFFAENLKDNDIIIYNCEIYGFLYEYYFDDKVVYMGDFDFGGDYRNIWFLNTPVEQQIPVETLNENGLVMEYVMHLGIEQNEFDLHRIYRLNTEDER